MCHKGTAAEEVAKGRELLKVSFCALHFHACHCQLVHTCVHSAYAHMRMQVRMPLCDFVRTRLCAYKCTSMHLCMYASVKAGLKSHNATEQQRGLHEEERGASDELRQKQQKRRKRRNRQRRQRPEARHHRKPHASHKLHESKEMQKIFKRDEHIPSMGFGDGK